MLHRGVVGAVALVVASATAQAGIVFSDNFNAENSGVGVLDYGAFTKWTVSDGTVDLIGNGFHDFQPGYGLYVDMDGSTSNAGLMTSSAINLGPGTYTLEFDLAGNHRNGSTEQVSVRVSLTPELTVGTYSLSQTAAFTTFTHTFTVVGTQSVRLKFEGAGGDNIGMLLDNVVLRDAIAVPLPSAAWLGLAGLGGVGLLRRRRRAIEM